MNIEQLHLPQTPIEVRMFDALRCIASYEFQFDPVVEWADSLFGDPLLIRPQETIGRYCADFLVEYRLCGKSLKIAVECDGHDYHERTHTQASHDRRRDQIMQSLGYKVFRFTGSDINCDSYACAREVLRSIVAYQAESVKVSYSLNGE